MKKFEKFVAALGHLCKEHEVSICCSMYDNLQVWDRAFDEEPILSGIENKTESKNSVMTKEEFWEKWEPADHPPIVPACGTKLEFMADLDAVIKSTTESPALETAPDTPSSSHP